MRKLDVIKLIQASISILLCKSPYMPELMFFYNPQAWFFCKFLPKRSERGKNSQLSHPCRHIHFPNSRALP